MYTQDLSGDGWTVRAVGNLSGVPERVRGRVFPARVPGCVHLDLIRAGVVRHPNLGYAEREQEWIGRTDWRYECSFVVQSGSPPLGGVSFDCLDTLAIVEFNGKEIGSASNFHIPQSFFLPAAREGENLLAITLRAPVPFVERAHADGAKLPYNGDFLGWHPFNMIRKPACNFGWDWGPRVATSGIAGGVVLLGSRSSAGWPRPPRVSTPDAGRWLIEVDVLPERAGPDAEVLSVGLSLRGREVAVSRSQAPGGDAVRLRLGIEEPEVWWPRGMGDQPLYNLRVRTRRGGVEHEQRWPIGFRRVALDTIDDDTGTSFALRINGRPVFCRGANWIPDALFPTEATPDRIRERVRQAADANMNMVRVWGGGLYEQDTFYDACDELGVMVWQDFMFACALYPEHSEFLDSVEQEVLEQCRRLSSHPSVVLWCGGNECVEGYQHWGWKSRLAPGAPWGDLIWRDRLPTLLESLTEAPPLYWPNSPWSGPAKDVRDPDHGDRHTWDLHFEDVRKIVPRFVSEFGRIAPACERTLWEAGVSEGAEGAGSWPCRAMAMPHEVREALEHRLRQTGGSSVAYDPVLPEHFRHPQQGPGASGPGDLRAWLWQTQVLQARALTTHIEWLRANSPRCMGALVWQLNDCWACQSWSLIDYAGRPKPAWYAVRRAFAPRRLTIQPLGEGHGPSDQGRGLSSPQAEPLSAVLVNDTDEAFEGECIVRRASFGGDELARATPTISAAAREVARVDALLELVGAPGDRTAEVLVIECAGDRDIWFWERDLRLHLPESPLRAALVREGDRTVVRLHANALARDIIIAADLLGGDARAAENCFTMLAGETREVGIDGTALDLGIGVGQVVRCASGPAV